MHNKPGVWLEASMCAASIQAGSPAQQPGPWSAAPSVLQRPWSAVPSAPQHPLSAAPSALQHLPSARPCCTCAKDDRAGYQQHGDLVFSRAAGLSLMHPRRSNSMGRTTYAYQREQLTAYPLEAWSLAASLVSCALSDARPTAAAALCSRPSPCRGHTKVSGSATQ